MDFGLSFSYIFNDKDWFRKIALPALCSLIPVIGEFVLTGWGLKAAKNVIDGNEQHALPDLEFGPDLGRGFMAFLITLIYSLPVAIMVGVSAGLFALGSNDMSEAGRMMYYIFGGCVGLFGLLIAVLFAFLGVVATANYVAKGRFGAAFDFKELFGLLKRSFGSWLLVIVGQILALGIIAPLGAIACGIGALFTLAFGTAVYSHLLGQAYNQSVPPAIGEI